jgi:acetyl esterase/lipase
LAEANIADGGTDVRKLAAALGSLAAVLWSLVGLAFTANGIRPLAKNGYPSLYAFAFGVFASELPLQMIAGQAVALLAATRRLRPRVRRFTWLVSGLSWLGLLSLDRIGRRANVPLTAALDAGLGTDRRTETIDIWRRPRADGATAKTPGVIRMFRIDRKYIHDADISYGPYGSRNHLDIWRRPDLDLDGRAPVLVYVPGGAWMVGSKQEQGRPLLSHLTELGWVCVVINYRLSPRSTWPDHIVDVKQAIAWVKAHIAEHGGDPDWVAISGASAGGQLAALAALTPNDPTLQPGFTDADTSVQAAVPFYGVYDFTAADNSLHPQLVPMLEERVLKQKRAHFPEAYRASSPITHVSADAPPFFVLHGTNDSLIPVEQARRFVARLRDVCNRPVVYAELPYAQHAFEIFGSARAAHAAVAVEQFLAEIYAPRHSQQKSA